MSERRRRIRRVLLAAFLLGGPFAWSCSSGGGSDDATPQPGNTPPPAQTLSGTAIQGTVPGTIIHAFGDDGSYYRTETNPGDPAPRPFRVVVKPGIGYRLVLEENGALYPLVFDSGQGETTKRFYMSLVNATLDLGNVLLSGGLALAQVNPLSKVDSDGDGTVDVSDADFELVVDDPVDADGDGVPNALDSDFVAVPSDRDRDGVPDARDFDIDNDGLQNAADSDPDDNGPDSIPDVLARGIDQAFAANPLGAYQSFQAVVAQDPGHQLGNLGLAVTRIAAALTDLNPGTDPARLETMKEVLDRLGFGQNSREPWAFRPRPPVLTVGGVSCFRLPDDSPTAEELRVYVNDRLLPQIRAALTSLDAITPGFTYAPPQPIMVSGKPVIGEVDYGDVLVLKTVLRTLLTFVTFVNAYDIDVDVDTLFNNYRCDTVDPDTYQHPTRQALFDQYPDFGKLVNPSVLPGLKTLANATLDDAIAALQAIQNETDDQSDDLFTTDPTDFGTNLGILQTIKASFNGQVTLALGNGKSFTWNAAPIFSGTNLRNYVPALNGNRVVYESIRSPSYDPTINGILPLLTRDDIVAYLDGSPPNVTVSGFSDPLTTPMTFQVQVDDLHANPIQVGSGVDPTSLAMWWTCSPVGVPAPECALIGRLSDGTQVTTPPYLANITELLAVSDAGPDGVYTWTPNGGSVAVETGGASLLQVSGWVEVRDRAGNFRYYPLPTSTLTAGPN